MKKYCLAIFLMLVGGYPTTTFAVSPPALSAPPGLSLAEIKITGNEFLMLVNNTNSTISDLSKYWLYYFNNTNPVAAGVSSSSQQLPPSTLSSGQTLLLSANGGPTCGAAVTARLSLSLADSGGYLQVVQQSLVSGVLTQTAGDSVSWNSGANSAGGMISNLPSSSSAPSAAYYRYQNTSTGAPYLWQLANQDTINPCQLNVIIAGSLVAGPVNPGNQLLPGTPPPAVFITEESSPVADLPPGTTAPIITELLPNPAEPKTDSEDEFIEIYNSGAQPFELTGFKLQTGTTTLHNYTFGEGTVIAAQSFATFYSIDTNLTLSNNGGQVRLLDPNGNLISQSETYSKADDGQSWALADGKWYWTTQPTPGANNAIKQPLTAKPYTLPSTSKKATTSKSAKTTSSAKSTGTKTTPATKPTKPQTNPPSLHPLVLAGVGALAVAYAAYEYRHDLHNRLYQFRRYRTARRASRVADLSAARAGAGRGPRRWQNQLGAWLGTRLW